MNKGGCSRLNAEKLSWRWLVNHSRKETVKEKRPVPRRERLATRTINLSTWNNSRLVAPVTIISLAFVIFPCGRLEIIPEEIVAFFYTYRISPRIFLLFLSPFETNIWDRNKFSIQRIVVNYIIKIIDIIKVIDPVFYHNCMYRKV